MMMLPADSGPKLLAQPDMPDILGKIELYEEKLAEQLNIPAHEVHLLWWHAQVNQDNELVLSRIKALFTAVKMVSEEVHSEIRRNAEEIHAYDLEVERVDRHNKKVKLAYTTRLAARARTAQVDTRYSQVNPVYLAFMRRLKKGIEWATVTPNQRELIKALCDHEHGFEVVRYRGWLWDQRIRMQSDRIPMLNYDLAWYDAACKLLED